MNRPNKISWRAAAITAALLVSGVASADHRGGHHNDRGSYGGRDRGHDSWRGGDHQRVWRNHGRHDYRFYDRGYRHGRHQSNRYYYYPQDRYFSYGNYYGTAWPDYGFGATLTFGIPLH